MSIHRFLLVSLLLSITLVMAIAGTYAYVSTSHEIDEVFDARLAQYTRLLAHYSTGEQGWLSLPLAHAPVIQHKYENNISFQIWNEQGASLLGASSNAGHLPLGPFRDGFHDVHTADGKAWKVFVLHDEASRHWLMSGESLDIRNELVTDIANSTVFPLLGGGILSLLLVSVILGRGLAPLERIAEAITTRRPDDLSPMTVQNTPVEIKPIIININTLLYKVKVLLDKEKRFVANAAHELKTPLASLKLHLSNLERHIDGNAEPLLDKALQASRQLEHLLEQLLALNRLGPGYFDAHREPVRVNALCREILSQEAELAVTKRQALEFTGTSEELVIPSNSTILAMLIRNLVHNAILYTQAGGRIHITTSAENGHANLVVTDNGPGIADDQKDRVFERFYRADGDMNNSGVTGSGLGLAIVREIVELHAGQISLHDAPGGRGLLVRVQLPLRS